MVKYDYVKEYKKGDNVTLFWYSLKNSDFLNACGKYMMKNFLGISPTTFFVSTLYLMMDTTMDYWNILQGVLECTCCNITVN
jgi:hypothetical protein